MHRRNVRGKAVDKGLDLVEGGAKASFERDRFLSFDCAGTTASFEK